MPFAVPVRQSAYEVQARLSTRPGPARPLRAAPAGVAAAAVPAVPIAAAATATASRALRDGSQPRSWVGPPVLSGKPAASHYGRWKAAPASTSACAAPTNIWSEPRHDPRRAPVPAGAPAATRVVPVQGCACARRADVPAFHRTSGTVIRDLACAPACLPPSCGPVRLIGVDGHAGSGEDHLRRTAGRGTRRRARAAPRRHRDARGAVRRDPAAAGPGGRAAEPGRDGALRPVRLERPRLGLLANCRPRP